MSVAGLIVAILAIVVSAAVAWKANRIQRTQTGLHARQAELQQQLVAIEAARRQDEVERRGVAEPTVQMPDGSTFVFENLGPATAREVILRRSNEDPVSMSELPITALPPHQPHTVHSDATFNMAGAWDGWLEWRDERGDHRVRVSLSNPGGW
jgi:hypothetical protein